MARETDDVEQVTPAIFELIHSWLLEPGNADTLFGHAETIGAGILAKKLYEAGVGGRGTELEHGCECLTPCQHPGTHNSEWAKFFGLLTAVTWCTQRSMICQCTVSIHARNSLQMQCSIESVAACIALHCADVC